ncbi:SDR family oxidoreductase [Georgenia thermotolerans]|nr:SDR family oxidoreductase [Georgenia thermotolerans]
MNTPEKCAWDANLPRPVMSAIQMHRPAQAREIAGIVLFLSSDQASSATGGVFTVDGGQTAH